MPGDYSVTNLNIMARYDYGSALIIALGEADKRYNADQIASASDNRSCNKGNQPFGKKPHQTDQFGGSVWRSGDPTVSGYFLFRPGSSLKTDKVSLLFLSVPELTPFCVFVTVGQLTPLCVIFVQSSIYSGTTSGHN